MGYVFYYSHAYFACILLLAVVLLKLVRSVNKQALQIYLANLIITLIFYFFAEIFWAIVDGGLLGPSPKLVYFSNIFTYILISVAAYTWFVLSEVIQRDKFIESPQNRSMLAIPAIVASILCVSAVWTGLAFYVDENGKLVNGSMYLVLIIVPFGYMIAASIKAFLRYFNKDRYADRNIYLMIAIFPIAPITLGILQAIFWRIPFLCYGAVLAVFYVYTTIQDNLISIDPLTQTNNRNQMYKYLIQKMKNEEPGMSLFLIMVDINRLREINELYGHAEGDRALIRVASAIKEACQSSRNRMFVSRYSGDEFVIVAEMAYRAEATYLGEQIKTELRRANSNDGAPCDVTVSIGIAQYDYQAPVAIPAFIARADSDLYQNKKLNAG